MLHNKQPENFSYRTVSLLEVQLGLANFIWPRFCASLWAAGSSTDLSGVGLQAQGLSSLLVI